MAVIREGGKGQAILFERRPAVLTGAARIHHAPHGTQVTGPELGNAGADSSDAADNLMARHAGINCVVPFIPGLMQIGVTDPAVENFDFDIQRARFAPGNTKRSQRRSCALRCTSLDFGRSHGFSITPIKSPSLAERANLLAKHATVFEC